MRREQTNGTVQYFGDYSIDRTHCGAAESGNAGGACFEEHMKYMASKLHDNYRKA